MKSKLEALIEEARIQSEEHPSKDARWFASSVYEFLTQRQWVELTPEEVVNVANAELSPKSFARGAAWANAKLKEKNT